MQLRPGCRRAATAVEFAFAGPVLLIMVLGLIEFGRALMTSELLTDAARHGCRVAILEGTSTQQITDTVKNYLSGFSISAETVSVVINDGVGNVTEASTVPAYTEITVTVTIPATSVTWLPAGVQIYLPGVGYIPISMSGTLSGQFTMRRE